MGYTQYIAYRPQGDAWGRIWPTLLDNTREIVQFAVDQGYAIGDGLGAGEPEISHSHIMLNGVGEAGCEAFHLVGPEGAVAELARQQPARDYVFGYCKTNREAYDAVVGAVMLRAAQLCPQGFVFGSDGDWTVEWEEGAFDPLGARPIARAIFGTDQMPEPAHEYFFSGIDAGELFLRLGRSAAIGAAPPVDVASLADTLFADDGPGL